MKMKMATNTKPMEKAYKAFQAKSKPTDIRSSNISAAKAVSDAIRTSLGPRGMDKMIQTANGEVTITNDGATILKQMNVIHPAAKMLVELSKAQDSEAGDGTTSVVIIAGALLEAAEKLLQKGIHPTLISNAFRAAADESVYILDEVMSVSVDITDHKALTKVARTSLNSKIVSQQASLLAPLAASAVLKIAEPGNQQATDLKDIKIIKQLGGTVEDTKLIEGLVFTQRSCNVNGPKRIEKAKIGLIQFCISPPKTDMDHGVIVSDYSAMDRILKEERAYILNIVKQIKKAGCNVLLIQKSILRDALSDLAIHFLDKIKVMVIKDIEREDISFICKTIGCKPIASLDYFTAKNLVNAELCEEVQSGGSKYVQITGMQNPGRTATILIKGSNKLVLEETERSLHDALCAVRCLMKQPSVIAGGGAPEMELVLRLSEHSKFVQGVDTYCVQAFANALEVIPLTLAENAGLNPVATVTELRKRHAENETRAGIDVQKGMITQMSDSKVFQPLLVSASCITLATETVCSILKIDDIVNTMQ